MEDKKIINENIRRALIYLRQINGYTQSDISKIVNKTPTGVASWEQGRCVPSPEDLYKLSKVYEVNMDYFFNYGTPEAFSVDMKFNHDPAYPIDMKVTRSEYKLILELRERNEIDIDTLEKMFNTILEYKQKDKNFKLTTSKNMKFNITVNEFLNGDNNEQ